ncbi:phage tail protein I [Klebsiella pneumoniae]|nr:phage tail protein I [Klebsiella pneumoniae]UOV84367.1 phage tail protein I [Klebsiella pneumoniae]
MSDLLPNNATPLEAALAEAIARISDVPTPARDVWNPDTCQANLLPWLAWAFSVDEWDADWSEAQKRAAIKAAVPVQRYKGTIGAVREALAALGFGVQVQEWFNQLPAGAPYTYRLLLTADQVGVDQSALKKILQVVETAKNLRSHMDVLVPSVTTRATLYSAGANGIGNEITISYQAYVPPVDLVLDGTWQLNGSQQLNGVRQ